MSEAVNLDNLSYENFRLLDLAPNFELHQTGAVPNAYREGDQRAIFHDTCSTLSLTTDRKTRVIQISLGFRDLDNCLIECYASQDHSLVFVGSVGMLSRPEDHHHITQLAEQFPDILGLTERFAERFDVIPAYSLIQCLFADANYWNPIDIAPVLLRDDGRLLIGDIPKTSMHEAILCEPIRRETPSRAYT